MLGVSSVGAAGWSWHSRNVSETSAQFRSAADGVSESLSRTLLEYGGLLSGSAALFHQGVVTRTQYDAYLQAVGFGSSRFPGLEGVGLIQRLSPGQVPGFLAVLRHQGLPAAVYPPGHRAEYCLGSYAAWADPTLDVPLYGYDACAVPSIASALSRATASGDQQVLPGTVLGAHYRTDFVLVQPVYGGSAATERQRELHVSGWALAFIDGPQLIRSLHMPAGVDFVLLSGSAGPGQQATIAGWQAAGLGRAGWTYSDRIEAFGPWVVRYRQGGAFPEAGGGTMGPVIMLVIGLVAVALLVMLLTSLSSARRRAELAVSRATTSLRDREQRFRRLIANSSDLIGVIFQGEIVAGNPAAERLLGARNGGEPRTSLLDLVHPDDRDRASAAWAGLTLAPGAQARSVYRIRDPEGIWRVFEAVETNCLADPAVGGIVVNARDVTESANLTRALRTLGQGTQALVHASDETSLLAETCRTIVEQGGYPLAWVGYALGDEARTVSPVAAAGLTGYLAHISLSWGDGPDGQGPTGVAIRTGTVQVLDDMGASESYAKWQQTARHHGFRTSCSFPLRIAGQVLGALNIYAAEPGAFAASEVALLGQLADALAYGIGRTRDGRLLAASEARFRSLAGAAPIGILELSAGAFVEYANPKMGEIAGRPAESLLGRGWIEALHTEDAPEVFALIERLHLNRGGTTSSFRIVRPDGEARHVRVSTAPKGEEPGNGWVCSIEDVTEEVRAHEELAHQAFYDNLTGLPNRALFLDRLEQELARRQRGGPNVAVLFLDLDRFKIVNDSLGHQSGDAVLKVIGHRLKVAVRAGETAARFGGDEFVFIIREVRDVADAVSAARRLLSAVEAPVPLKGQELTINGSIGIVIPGENAQAGAVVRDADTAMYEAKTAGRARYALFDEDLHRRSVSRLQLESELRVALERKEFEVYYQPIVEPASGLPLGAEALVRWHNGKRGLVPPLEFIPVAEDCGLINQIGAWVFEQAVSQLAAWDEDGPNLQVLSVNLSARQLDDEEACNAVSESLERHGIAPARVSLEVTESAVMSESDLAQAALRRFEDLGMRFAIDDFGTGYSSLAYLHTLPVTVVKVDRSFVQRLNDPAGAAPIVKAIVEMAHALGLQVVAEGVSDDSLRAAVAEMGCDAAQGFYWSPPLPAEDFAAWWREATRPAPARSGTA